VFPRDIVCLRNICVDTLHKGDIDDDSNDDDDNNNNNNNNNLKLKSKPYHFKNFQIALRFRLLTSSESKNIECRQICLSVTEASHSLKVRPTTVTTVMNHLAVGIVNS
jgi:hypothetical protein